MLKRAWEKLDRFYLVLAIVLSVMAVMLVVAFRSMFSAYLNAFEIDEKDVQVDAKVDKESLEEVYVWTMNKNTMSLQIRD